MTDATGDRKSGSNTGRTARGTFALRNPGKPKGARHRVTILAEQLMQNDAEGVVQAVVEAAKAGDMAAARIILDRIAPVSKGRLVSIPLPTILTTADVTKAVGAVVASMTSGDLTPEEANAIASVLETKRRALETLELEGRVAALEDAAGGHK